MVPLLTHLPTLFLRPLLFSVCTAFWGQTTGHTVSKHRWVPPGSSGQDVGNYLGILKHAEVSVHVECEVLVSTPLVQFGGLVELPLVGKHICQKQVIVGLSLLLPLLEKLEAQEMASAATAGSSLYKG